MTSYFKLDENSQSIAQPINFNIELMEHQKKSVYAMLELEKTGNVRLNKFMFFDNIEKDLLIDTKIGILADKIGSGKSYMILALLLENLIPKTKDTYYASNKYITIKSIDDPQKYINTNLLIVPNKLIMQWMKFINNIPALTVDLITNNTQLNNNITKNICLINDTIMPVFNEKYKNYLFNRIIIDEADTININSLDMLGHFIWLITGTKSGINYCNKKYIKNIFGVNKDWISDIITIKNCDLFINNSLKLPAIERIFIKCLSPPEINIIKQFIPANVLHLINAGNNYEAIKLLNCHEDTKENIYQVLNNNITKMINTKSLDLEIEKKNKNNIKIKSLEKSINNLISRLKTIKNKIIDENEDICPICLGDIINNAMVDCCGTIYCFSCIALTLEKYNKCAYCQKKIDKNNMHIINKKNDSVININKQDKLLNKIDNFLNIIKTNLNSKFIVFADYNETFNKLIISMNENNITYNVLKGQDINSVINDLTNGIIKVILLNAKNCGTGLNLQVATDIILYHRFTKELEEQIIGRAQRYGRTCQLKVHYLIHNNETNYVANENENINEKIPDIESE